MSARPTSKRLGAVCIAVAVVIAVLGCSPQPKAPASPVESERGEPIQYEFRGPDQAVLESARMLGRVTLIALITTYDISSQLLVRRLDDISQNYAPRVNVAAVVMEAPRYEELVRIFPSTLGLRFPVVMADPASLSGAGPFGAVDRIPTLIVLDSAGRLVQRFEGAPEMSQIRTAVASARRAR